MSVSRPGTLERRFIKSIANTVPLPDFIPQVFALLMLKERPAVQIAFLNLFLEYCTNFAEEPEPREHYYREAWKYANDIRDLVAQRRH